MSKTVPQRSEIAPEHTWDTASVFATDAAWEAEFARVAGELPKLARFQGRLGESPALLHEWLDTSEALLNAAGKVYVYASMLHNTNTGDQQASAQYDRATGLFNRAHFDGCLRREVNRCRRYGQSASLILMDLDDFKTVNDKFGHAAGDAVLRDMGRLLIQRVRDTGGTTKLTSCGVRRMSGT